MIKGSWKTFIRWDDTTGIVKCMSGVVSFLQFMGKTNCWRFKSQHVNGGEKSESENENENDEANDEVVTG